ncbi:4-amino-4-deoxy-L-arabinose transferase-like glycosyltransferase [Prauserella shujinwangii]|uniref:4-amino-4-deoxy-L-arabinose transferase-like glycosyltransferase n=1 Tax=Prauserella shujinwangii TaxID=1453103 RepID=A0A2T0LVX9_9PSEU|nr:4-amino-4-deoxy-L-arabinose transferase-like glycosyltransferase [Prauserella shujinwangii]
MAKDADTRETGRSGEAGPGSSRGFLARRDGAAWLVAGLALVLGGVFVGFDLAYNQGKLIAPLDDVYIHLRYGSQIGRGQFFEFHPGDPVSTGASSLLYAFVLGAGHLVGFRGDLLLPFAVVLGIGCLAGTTAVVYRLGRTFASRTVGVWAGILVAVSGPLLWGAASGMEVGLTALLLTGTVLAFVRERPLARFRVTPVLGALLALVRPEGLVVAVLIAGAMLWTVLRERRRVGAAAWSLLPVAAGAGQYAFYLLATGTATANGVRAKSHLHDRPQFFLGEFVDRTVANVRGFVDALAGLNEQDFAFPGLLLLAVGGLGHLLVTRREWRPLLVALSLGLAGVLVAAATLSTALIHELRYLQPFLPLFVLFAVCGVHALTRLLAGARARRAALHTVLVVALLFSLLALPAWAVKLGRQAATIRDTDVSVGAWVSGNLPPDAVVGVKDVGAVAYFGGRRTVDLIGLTTNGLAEPANNGTGALYEALRRLPEADRPDYFAVYEERPGPPMQPLFDAGLFGEGPLITFHVRTPPALDGFSIVPFRELHVFRADWRLAGTGDAPPPGVTGEIKDYLNTGDLAGEEAHGWTARMAQPGLQPDTVLRRQGDVVDSGRVIVGGERFTAGGLTPGEPLTIHARTLAPGVEREVRVRVDGTDVGTWRFHRSEEWRHRAFTVPGDAVTGESVTVELEPVRPLLSPYPEYTSFGYWFSQPR